MKFIEKNKRIFSLFLAIFIFVPFVFSLDIFAHNAYYISTTINEADKKVVTEVMYDEVGHYWLGLGSAKEVDHKENKLFDGNNAAYQSHMGDTVDKDNPPLFFTFPPKARKRGKDDIEQPIGSDAKRASEIANILVPSLNKLVYDMLYYNEGLKKFRDTKHFMQYLSEVAGLKQVDRVSESPTNDTDVPLGNNGSSLKVGSINDAKNKDSRKYVILDTKEGKKYYIFEAIKGYKTPILEDGSPSYLVDSGNQWSDVDTLNIGDIAFQALTYASKGIYSSNINEVKNPGVLERKVVEFLSSSLISLQSSLGLYTMEELVFSEGDRTPVAGNWVKGAVRTEWMEKGIGFYMIFTAIALSFCGIAFMRLLFKRILSASNPMMQFTFKQAIIEFLSAMIFMGLCLPAINLLLDINYKLAQLFRATVPSGVSYITGIGGEVTTIGGLAISFIWFVITIILNAQFLIRAIMIAFLIAIAPFAIMSITVQDGKREMFNNWGKELIANIFLQSFQAFVLSFFLNLNNSGRTMESIIISLSILPLSNFFKSLIMGRSGAGFSIGGAMGKAGSLGMLAGAGALAGGAIGVGKAGFKSYTEKKKKKQEESSSDSADSTDTGGIDVSSLSGVNSSNTTPGDNLGKAKDMRAENKDDIDKENSRTKETVNMSSVGGVNMAGPSVEETTDGKDMREENSGEEIGFNGNKENKEDTNHETEGASGGSVVKNSYDNFKSAFKETNPKTARAFGAVIAPVKAVGTFGKNFVTDKDFRNSTIKDLKRDAIYAGKEATKDVKQVKRGVSRAGSAMGKWGKKAVKSTVSGIKNNAEIFAEAGKAVKGVSKAAGITGGNIMFEQNMNPGAKPNKNNKNNKDNKGKNKADNKSEEETLYKKDMESMNFDDKASNVSSGKNTSTGKTASKNTTANKGINVNKDNEHFEDASGVKNPEGPKTGGGGDGNAENVPPYTERDVPPNIEDNTPPYEGNDDFGFDISENDATIGKSFKELVEEKREEYPNESMDSVEQMVHADLDTSDDNYVPHGPLDDYTIDDFTPEDVMSEWGFNDTSPIKENDRFFKSGHETNFNSDEAAMINAYEPMAEKNTGMSEYFHDEPSLDNKFHFLDYRSDDGKHLVPQWENSLPADKTIYKNFVENELKNHPDYNPKNRTPFNPNNVHIEAEKQKESLKSYTNEIERSMGLKPGSFDASKLTIEQGNRYEKMLFDKYTKRKY